MVLKIAPDLSKAINCLKKTGIVKKFGKNQYTEAPSVFSSKDSPKLVKINGGVGDSLGSFSLFSEKLIERTSPEQRKMLRELYDEYIKLSKKEISHNINTVIDKNSLLHGTAYDKSKVEEIFKNGLISPDIKLPGTKFRESYGEQRTIGGIDTWVSDKSRTIKEYFIDWLSEDPNKLKKPYFREFGWRGENSWIDIAGKGKKKNNIVFIFNPTKNKELETFTSHSVTPTTKKIGDKMVEKMYVKEGWERHTFVPVGLPANYIEKIVVGDSITSKQVLEIESLLKKYNLSAKIYSSKGKILSHKSAEEILMEIDFAKFRKDGLPLKYSRMNFISDIDQILKDLPSDEARNAFLKKYNLVRTSKDIDGIPVITGNALVNKSESAMRQHIRDFYYNNEIKIEDPSVKFALEQIIKDFPEFTMTIGKVQHVSHKFSVDIHSLEALKKILNYSQYHSLDNENKKILKIATLLHDIGKRGRDESIGHEYLSKKYAEIILRKHDELSEKTKSRILNLIENHHWFGKYNQGEMSAQEFGKIFPTKEDREMAIMFAKADFESINPLFHIDKLVQHKRLKPSQYEEVFKQKMTDLMRNFE